MIDENQLSRKLLFSAACKEKGSTLRSSSMKNYDDDERLLRNEKEIIYSRAFETKWIHDSSASKHAEFAVLGEK